jgi:hypothetical protein
MLWDIHLLAGLESLLEMMLGLSQLLKQNLLLEDVMSGHKEISRLVKVT